MKHALDSELVMLAQMNIKPERRDEFLEYTVQNLATSRSAEGNIAFDILVDETRPNEIVFFEIWETAKAQQAYMGWRIERGDLTTLMSFLAGEPKFTALRRVAG